MDSRIPFIDQNELVRIRRQLHMYPELRWDLPRTAALVREELDKTGIPYEADKYGQYTTVATINPEKTHFTIGLRADMDALPIHENNQGKPYRSRNEGVMHACGHDAHTAMMIGTARALYAIRDQIDCRVRLLFQPCEEGRPSGASVMCQHGVMDDIDCIVMCHVNCGDPTHVISSCPGVTNATSVAYKIVLGGKSVHVASPHMGVDALAAGVKIYNGIQTLVSREVDPFDTCVMAVCSMHAGTTVSTNADECVMEGSIRCLKDQTMAWARARLEKLVRLTAEETGVTWALSWSGDPLPSAHNDPALYEAFVASARQVVGPERVKLLLPSPGGEDFAYYEQHKPGLLFGLGMRNEEKGACHPAHTKDWDIDEDGLETGVKVFVQFVLDYMKHKPAPSFYCQLDYEGVPFPSPKNGFGNLANNGCGPLSVSMLIENMLGVPFPPEESARFFLECGARADVGTNLYVASKAVAARFGLRVRDTEDAQEAYDFLAAGRGMVIANTYGDRPADGYIGVFSDSGHYVLVTGVEDGMARVLDPMYRPGRFDMPGRAGKVRMEGNLAVADFSILASDCWHRPFFLFERGDREAL